jgi:pyridoxamine 5'-phosphate oxidase
MINFKNVTKDKPHDLFQRYYYLATEKGQSNIEAVVISSLDTKLNEVDSRMVNLKYIVNDEWIFFSNYKSKKSMQFNEHKQISALFYWPSINVQIRIKASIDKTSSEFSNYHFSKRSNKKNALAISSNQSEVIDSYDCVIKNYEDIFKNINNFKERPSYWGGFSFKPYHFEFWEGHESRLNRRDSYEFVNKKWKHLILQP